MSGAEWLHIVISILSGGALAAAATSYVLLRKLRPDIKRTEAETGEIEARSWVLLVQAQGDRITALEAKLKAREDERERERQRIDDLEDEVEELRDWIKARGLVPPERKRAKKAT